MFWSIIMHKILQLQKYSGNIRFGGKIVLESIFFFVLTIKITNLRVMSLALKMFFINGPKHNIY